VYCRRCGCHKTPEAVVVSEPVPVVAVDIMTRNAMYVTSGDVNGTADADTGAHHAYDEPDLEMHRTDPQCSGSATYVDTGIHHEYEDVQSTGSLTATVQQGCPGSEMRVDGCPGGGMRVDLGSMPCLASVDFSRAQRDHRPGNAENRDSEISSDYTRLVNMEHVYTSLQ
jgi:hypothetical protein